MERNRYDGTIDLSYEQMEIIEKCRYSYMIGRLVSGKIPTNVDSNGHIQFFVDPLCDDPRIVVDTAIAYDTRSDYIGFDYIQNPSMLPFTYSIDSYDTDEKEREIEEHFRNKLIIFHPMYTKSRQNGKWFKNFLITSLVPDNIDEYFSFVPVPRASMDVAMFEERLKKGEYFEIDGYDGECNEIPDVIICGQFAYKLDNDGLENELHLLDYNSNIQTRWKCFNFDHVVKIDLSSLNNYKTSVIRASDSVFFIERNLFSDILKTQSSVLFEDERKMVALKEAQEKAALVKEKEQSTAETKKVKDDINTETVDTSIANKEIENSEEIMFIDALQQLTLDNGLQYKKNDLINFHISVKTNPLTILAGMSGTGKSRLAMNYAKMLDLSEDNGTLLFMPISPAYTEPSDVLGYLNSMNGLYVPSESGLVQFLLHAQENLNQMHMVIFDEMNLSQVEYWFSPFISILEKDKGDRILKLYDQDARCINEKVYPPSVKVGSNVIFVGTVNIDDTTKDFSDRLLDRTFVINLGMVSFTDFLKDYLKNQMNTEKVDVMRYKCKNVNQFSSWCHGGDHLYMSAFENNQEELQFFDELNELIQHYIPDGGISHRVMKNIGNYILNVPVKDNDLIIPRSVVFDIVINQTIMTKVRGTETQLQGLIGTLNEKDELSNSGLIALLDKYNQLSSFETVKKNLLKKAKELSINGYTN